MLEVPYMEKHDDCFFGNYFHNHFILHTFLCDKQHVLWLSRDHHSEQSAATVYSLCISVKKDPEL